MTKKNVIEMVTANKARINETSKHYEMSQNDFDSYWVAVGIREVSCKLLCGLQEIFLFGGNTNV